MGDFALFADCFNMDHHSKCPGKSARNGYLYGA
jgi:hypothetical protein